MPNILPPLSTLVLVHPEYIANVFRAKKDRAAYFHQHYTQLWETTLHHPNESIRQRAHQNLVALNQITRNALDRQQAKRLAKAAALQSQRQEEMKKAAALETMNLSAVGESVAIGEAGFVHLDTIPSGQRICAMCKRGYPVQHGDDGDASLGHYPVQLSCHHLVCFGCAKVMLRMHVNCTCCGGTFGDGKSELAKIEEQIQLCRQWLRDVIAVKSVGVGGKFTQEDLDAALTLLSIAGKDISMEDIHAGLALLDLQAGTDTTLEEYLLTISP